jgi:group II intron reverse transcriptase/maturase
VKEKLQGVDPITNGEDHTNVGASTKPTGDPAQSKTPRTSGNIMHVNRETWSEAVARYGDRPAEEGQGQTFRRQAGQESDSGVVPMKGSNKGGQPTAESLEGRPETKENVRQPHMRPTQGGERMSQGLEGVRRAAKERKQEKFTALLHHLTIDVLRESFYNIKRSAAAGVDQVTWKEYAEGVEDRLRDLHDRVHRGAYRAQPSRRVYILKSDGRQRPLGVAVLEDKIVQQAVTRILNQIYETDFQGVSYGFRPGRSQHQALDALTVGIERKKVNWILDLDIRGFFDNLNHEQLVQYVEERIADPRMLRLIRKWLKAGVMEDGEWKETEVGTPQGSSISPLLANVYLHYALDLWVMAWRRQAVGDVIMVRYADDAVLGFENREEAERLRRELQEQLRRVGLELHPEKTRMIEFGRFAESNRKRRGEGKPETFDFLGFTHMCGRTRTAGRFTVKRKTIGKRMRAKLQEIRQQLRQRMHDAVPETGKWLRSVVQGYFNYHAVPGNGDRMQAFRDAVTRYWWWTLSRRSQKGRIDWERMRRLVRRWIPSVRIMHPYPSVRFDAIHPR